MRDYGKIHTSFWASDTIRGLSEDGRLLAIYLMTSPHSTIAGVFRLPDGYVCEDVSWEPERIAKVFAELFAKGFANRCETTKWVWILKHLEWNPPENPNQRKAASKVACSVPDECGWKQAFMRACGEALGLKAPEKSNPSETVPKPFRNQEQEQEQENTYVADATPRDLEKQILDAYHELLPNLPAVKIWGKDERKNLADRIRETVKRGVAADSVDYWRRFFAKVDASDFLSGRTKDPWRCGGLKWLIKPKNFAKVIEGNYDNPTNGGTHGRSYSAASTPALG
jgi:hypothetical protein